MVMAGGKWWRHRNAACGVVGGGCRGDLQRVRWTLVNGSVRRPVSLLHYVCELVRKDPVSR